MNRINHNTSISNTIAHLAPRWDKANKQILRHVFPLLAKGKPFPVNRLAQTAGISSKEAEETLKLGRAQLDDHGNVKGLFGFGFNPTIHRLQFDGITMFCCCALFSHIVPYLAGKTANIESVDPVSRKLISLRISLDGIQSVNPSGSVGVLVTTTDEAINENISANFCSQVNHFVSLETASQYIAYDNRRYILTMPEFHDAAVKLYNRIWK